MFFKKRKEIKVKEDNIKLQSENIPVKRHFNNAIFTNNKFLVKRSRFSTIFATWYDDVLIANGRGRKLDNVFIDLSLSKEYIKNIIIPICSLTENVNVFIYDEKEDRYFTKTTVTDVLSLIQ